MVLAFKHQFVHKIWSGQKIHSIREDKKNRWHPGQKIHMATGVRTNNYTCFSDSNICTGTQRIFMTYFSGKMIEISIDEHYLSHSEIDQLVKNDGFDSYDDFFNYFYPMIMAHKDEYFSGKIIHWTDFRYKSNPAYLESIK